MMYNTISPKSASLDMRPLLIESQRAMTQMLSLLKVQGDKNLDLIYL